MLHTAAVFDCVETAEYLLSIGHNINAVDNAMETPAHKAARAGNTRMLGKLKAHGARAELENFEGDNVQDLVNCDGWFAKT